jgi:hypothetical protein
VHDPFVRGMAGVRFLSSAIECTAAILMLRLGRVDAALRINGLLGLVGPAVLVLTTALGVAGLAGRVPFAKLLLVVAGVYLIFYATR